MASYRIRSKRRALLSLALVIALLAAAIATGAWYHREATTYEIREDRILTPAADPTDAEPTPPPAPLPETWTRYDVPLDDDLQRYTADVCKQYDVPTALVLAVMDAESGYDADALGDLYDGHYQSFGLMQIWASEHTARCIRLNTYNLLDARQNILTGVDYLAELISWGYGVEYAVSWYHGDGGGPSEYARLVLAEAERLEESAMIDTY